MQNNDIIKMDKKRKDRRSETDEVFTPFSLLEIMSKYISDDTWNDPTKIFLDNCCGNGQIILFIINKKLELGHSYIQALSTTYGLDIMEDNIIECKQRIINFLNEKNITYDLNTVNKIINHNIKCGNALKWDYENWCPIKENKSIPLF